MPRSSSSPAAPALRALPFLALILAMLSVQLGAVFAKELFPRVGAAGASALRVSLGAALLIAAVRPWRGGPIREGRGALLGYGVSLGAMNLVFYLALARIPLGLAVGLEFAGPLGVALLSSRRPRDVLCALLAAGGLCLLLPLAAGASRVDLVGCALALAAGGFWALYILFGARAGRVHRSRAVAIGSAVAALLVLPVGLASAGPAILNPTILGLGALVALLSSAVPYLLEMSALRRLPPRVFGVLMSGEPAVAAVLGFACLGEALSWRQCLGLCAVTAASLLAASGTGGPALQDPP